jgi:hypothetical protein
MTESTNKSKIFTAYKNFVSDLNAVFEKQHHPLKMYNLLLSRTLPRHVEVINKHVSAISTFCLTNATFILEKNYASFDPKETRYSENAYIDLHFLFELANKENKELLSTMWKHLLYILSLVSPEHKDEIKEEINSIENKEEKLLESMFERIEKQVSSSSNPMDVLNSGVISELTNELKSGDIDVGKMLQQVQKMITKVSAENGGDPQLEMLANILPKDGQFTPESMPQMMQGMMSMMSSLAMGGSGPVIPNENNLPKIEEEK